MDVSVLPQLFQLQEKNLILKQGGVYLGHRSGVKDFIVYDLTFRDIIVFRNVTFHESIFPFRTPSVDDTSHVTPSNFFALAPPNDSLCFSMPSYTLSTSHPPTHSDAHALIDAHGYTTAPMPNSLSIVPITLTNPPQQPSPQLTIKSTRTRKPPSYLQDFHCILATLAKAAPSSLVLYPLSNYLSYDKLSPSHKHFIFSFSNIVKPKCYHQAAQFVDWRATMDAEIYALNQTRT